MTPSPHILVGQSYYLSFDPKSGQGGQPYPPLGSLIAAACLRQEGYDVAFFDAMPLARPPRQAVAPEQVVQIMREEAGAHFDPDILDVFLRSLEDITSIQAEYR